MFCTKCGAQLQDDAKFCTACGARVAHPNATCAQAATCEANLEEAAPLPPNPSADMATDAHAPETTLNANSTDNVSPTHAATNPGVPSDASAGEASSQTLKSAVKQTTQRSRRRVPLVVLVAWRWRLPPEPPTPPTAYTSTLSRPLSSRHKPSRPFRAATSKTRPPSPKKVTRTQRRPR